MKFEEAIEAIRNKKKVRRKSWGIGKYISAIGVATDGIFLSARDLVEDDWELVEEKRQYKSITYHKVDGKNDVVFAKVNKELCCCIPVADGIDLTGREIKITVETVD